MIRETKHFISYYHDEDKNLAEQFILLLEEKYKEIHNNFHFEMGTKKYHFNFCKDVDEYIEKTGKRKDEYQSWMVGNSNVDTLTISILSPNAVTDDSTQDMEKVAVHELVHMVFDDTTNVSEDDTEAWIAEGIAILYADQTDLNYISASDYPKVMDWIGFENFADHQGYDYAGIYVWYFIRKFGFDKFLEMYCGKCEWQKLIYDGFESEAISSYNMNYTRAERENVS